MVYFNAQNPANADVRQAIANAGLYLWQVAAAVGITDTTLSKKLRTELSDDYKQRIYKAIDELKGA